MAAGLRQSWLFEYEQLGGHTHITVRCGVQDHGRAKAGQLVLKNDEWERLHRALHTGFVATGSEDDGEPETFVEFKNRRTL